jgi:hypothetical protein
MFPHPNEVFLSFSSLDWRFAIKIAEVLRRHGISVWHSGNNLLGAQQWYYEIGEALRRCDWFIVLLSPNSIKSIWVERELTFALNQQRYNNRIVPVVLQTCNYDQFSWSLSLYQVVDFRYDFETGCRALLRIWDIDYRPPTP